MKFLKTPDTGHAVDVVMVHDGRGQLCQARGYGPAQRHLAAVGRAVPAVARCAKCVQQPLTNKEEGEKSGEGV